MRALLDTNIVFDALCKRPHDEEGLQQMKIMHEFGDVDLWVSAKSYTDLFYVMRQELGSEAAQDLLEDTFSWLHACSVEEGDVQAAMRREGRCRLSRHTRREGLSQRLDSPRVSKRFHAVRLRGHQRPLRHGRLAAELTKPRPHGAQVRHAASSSKRKRGVTSSRISSREGRPTANPIPNLLTLRGSRR